MEEFEMPTPCINCGKIFDLNDGYSSEKWYPNVVICEQCHEKEEEEIVEDERWEGINNEVTNALYEVVEEDAWKKLTRENQILIIKIADNVALSSLLIDLYGFRYIGALTSDTKEGIDIAIEQVERYLRRDLDYR